MVSRLVDGFDVTGQDGRRLWWEDLSAGQPVVLIFVKQDCPCSVQVEPFFQRVERLYHDQVRFASVIDAGVEAARRYAQEQAVPHPVLADPERQLIGCFQAKNACYVVLLTPNHRIDGLWPGCSADTMQQLSRRIAQLAGVKERSLDVSGMPGPLTTGCPF
jgi:peroxiredoxin